MILNLPSSSISQDELNNILNNISSNTFNINSLTNTYNTGIQQIATKISQCGVSTANNASPSTMVNNIGSIYTNRYNQGINDGRQGYYSQAQYDNWGSTRYNAGITDGRVGYYSQQQYDNWGNIRYNAGVNDGKSEFEVKLAKSSNIDFNTILGRWKSIYLNYVSSNSSNHDHWFTIGMGMILPECKYIEVDHNRKSDYYEFHIMDYEIAEENVIDILRIYDNVTFNVLYI